MTRSKGPAEEYSLPPTRVRKDVSTANEGEENAQGQVQANVPSQQRTADMPSPFAQPGSRAGTCTTPASDEGMLPKASNPFTRPDSRAGSAPPEPTSPQSSVSSTSDNQLREGANTSVSWDLVDTDTDAEVADINSSLSHKTVTDQHFTGSTNATRNNAVGLSNEINTLYNQDFFVADTTGRRLSQVADKSNYSSLLPNGNAALQLRLPDLLIYLKTDTYLIDVKTGHHYAVYHNRIEKLSVLPKLYSAWPYRQLLQAIHDDAVRFGVNSPEPAASKESAPVQQPSSSMDSDVQTAQKQQPSPCLPTIVKYEPPSFNLQIPIKMLTRAERDQVLRNHMTAASSTLNKVAVFEDLMRQEPHNAAHYKEVQRVQKNQHIQVAIKLYNMLEADNEFRQSAGLPQLDLPEHLWTVRNMDTRPVREQHFTAISSEVEVLRHQLKGKGVYPAPPNYTQINQQTVPLTTDQLQALQTQDEKCTSLTDMLKRGKLDPLVYSMNDGVLHRRVIEGGQTFQAIYVPKTPPGLIESILKAAHDDSGHNGFPRTYSAIRRLYYWKGIKEDVRQHCTNCYTCQLHRTAAVKFEAKHFKPGMRPMDFIAMDLIGEFHPPSSQGNRYALTGICMLTGFTWCIPLKSKKAAEVSRAYLQHVYSVLGGSTKILTDNGTEFKNEVFKEMLQKLGTEKLIHSPPYRPQSNGRIEGFHRYLKACMAKYMRAGLEWDEVTAMATAAYNYFPNMSAKESAFFLMYGRDPLNKLSAILNAPRRYLGDATGFPDLEALKNMYQMVAQQLMNSRERYVKSNRYNKIPDHGILVGDLVLVKDHTAKSFQPKYKEDFRVVQVYGTNALQVSDKRGKLHNVHITDVRKINMTEKIAAQLQETYNNKGRTAKHLIPQGRIPDLGWNTDQQGKERQKLPNTTPEAPVTQTTPQQAEGPPSSRLRSKSKITTLMDSQNHNVETMDQHNALPQVNQVHTVCKAGFGWQAVVALTIIVNLIVTLFLCFRM